MQKGVEDGCKPAGLAVSGEDIRCRRAKTILEKLR